MPESTLLKRRQHTVGYELLTDLLKQMKGMREIESNGQRGLCIGQFYGQSCYSPWWRLQKQKALMHPVLNLLIPRYLQENQSDGDALYALYCKPLVRCPDSFHRASA